MRRTFSPTFLTICLGTTLAVSGLFSAREAVAADPPPADATKAAPYVQPREATKERPYVNKLGMRFVPVPGTNLLFCIWETRVQEYQLFAKATNRPWEKPDFAQEPTHPAVMVNRDDAAAFCAWLSGQDNWPGTDAKQYRLPTDEEWSAAAGLGKERGTTPEEKNFRASGYPWGKTWPPARGAGNYGPKLAVDDFQKTAPVGSFAANALGLHDLGGNVWEWCESKYDEKKEERVLRGGAWNVEGESGLRSSSRSSELPAGRFPSVGFRCVLVGGGR